MPRNSGSWPTESTTKLVFEDKHRREELMLHARICPIFFFSIPRPGQLATTTHPIMNSSSRYHPHPIDPNTRLPCSPTICAMDITKWVISSDPLGPPRSILVSFLFYSHPSPHGHLASISLSSSCVPTVIALPFRLLSILFSSLPLLYFPIVASSAFYRIPSPSLRDSLFHCSQ